MRNSDENIRGYDLVAALKKYSERGADYIKTIRIIMRVNALHVFDDARLGEKTLAAEESVNPDA